MQTASQFQRPAFVSFISGGRQDFPKDQIHEARLHRLSREAAKREGRTLVRRIPKQEVK